MALRFRLVNYYNLPRCVYIYVYTYVPHCDVTGMIRIGGIMAKWPRGFPVGFSAIFRWVNHHTQPGYVKIAIEAMAQSKWWIYPAPKWWIFPVRHVSLPEGMDDIMWLKQCHKPPMTGNGLYHLYKW